MATTASFDSVVFNQILTDIQTGIQQANAGRMDRFFESTEDDPRLQPIRTTFFDGTHEHKIPNYLLQSSNIMRLDSIVCQFKDVTIIVSSDKIQTESLYPVLTTVTTTTESG
jgi:hypothetical protein